MNPLLLAGKILATCFLALLPVAVLLCDRLIPRDRVRLYGRVTHTLVLLWYVASLLVIALLWRDTYALVRTRSQAQAHLEEDAQLEMSTQQLRDLVELQREQLEAGRAELVACRNELAELSTSRARSDLYDYFGFRLERRADGDHKLAGRTCMVYNQMADLARQEQWGALAKLAEEETRRTPDWLTPRLFAGLACARNGEGARARGFLEYVRKHALGDPQYAMAGEVLDDFGEDGELQPPNLQVRLLR